LRLQRLGVPVNVRPVDPLPTVEQLDLARYAGRWYEIARLQARHSQGGRRDATVDYTLDEQGGLQVASRCVHEDGTVDEATGYLRIPDGRLPGQAEVSFAPEMLRWYPGAWDDCWVLFVDQGYGVALVGTPDRDRLRVLAREPSIDEHDLEALKSLALRHGFDTTRLQRTPQGGDGAVQARGRSQPSPQPGLQPSAAQARPQSAQVLPARPPE